MTTSLLKPGILVSLKSSLDGGVTYVRKDLDAEVEPQTQEEIARWETTRVISDREEHERAVKARSAAVARIRRECAATSFGLLCPISNEAALDQAVQDAREIVRSFNATATHTTISVYTIKGRIAETDEEATRAIASEITSLLNEMEQGVRKLDVKSIRDAANRARSMNSMLESAQADKVETAIEQARKAARAIVKRIEKGGEDAKFVLADLQTGAIQKARFAFLDDEVEEKPAETVMPSVETRRFSFVDSEVA